MMFFKNLSIRFKILIPVALLGCLMFILGITSLRSAGQIMEASEEFSGKYAVSIEKLQDVTIAYQTLRRVAFAHIVENDESRKQTLTAEADSLKAEITVLCEEYETLLSTAEEEASFRQLQSDYADYLVIYDEILEYSTNNQDKEASALANTSLRTAGVALTEELDSMISVNKRLTCFYHS